MVQLHSLLLQQYGINAKSFSQVRSVYKVDSDQGAFAVKFSKMSPQQMIFLHQRISYFHQFGFTGAIPYKVTRNGLPFVQLADWILYVVPWIEGQSGKSISEHSEQIGAIFTQLGHMHRLGSSRYRETGEDLIVEVKNLVENWNVQIQRLVEYREQVSSRVYPSPVDVVFMANVDEIKDMAVEATGRLEEWLNRMEDQEQLQLTFCHGRLHFEHIIIQDHPIFINFDRGNLDVPARDLSYLIRHLTTQLGDRVHIERWMDRYMREYMLTREDVEILSISLQYPTSIFQFLEGYYSHQYAGKWTELTLVRRFEKMLNEQYLLLNL